MNSWRDLFVTGRIPPRGRAVPSAADLEKAAFITPQTLTSFVGASMVIGVISRVIMTFLSTADPTVVAAMVAIVIGLVVLAINVTDPRSTPSGRRGWFIAIIVGLINTFYLAAVALGVFQALGGT